jgi:wyosine [tRNA(Phe)-imidazoG37] synthetase (radical SAM superfamily)
MTSDAISYVYGPVWSRRLGRSLGVDPVPFKTCTYDCIYCQLGRTTRKTIQRRSYLPAEAILSAVKEALTRGPVPDVVTLAGSGEPTLNADIGILIEGIKQLTSIPVAVLTNGSLLGIPDVQKAVKLADLVLPSLDAGDAKQFVRVNRPHAKIHFDRMVDGLAEFTACFGKPVWLEVFVLAGITDNADQMAKIAALTRKIRPAKVQFNTVARPPCKSTAKAAASASLNRWRLFFDPPADVIAAEEIQPASPQVPVRVTDAAILNLLVRRPCTAQGVAQGLGLHSTEALKRLEALCGQGRAATRRQGDILFYVVPPAPQR